MIAFADTSGLYALLARNDRFHSAAAGGFSRLAQMQARLQTTSYVLVKTLALLQHRIGVDAVKAFQARLMPLLEIVWIDAPWHERAMARLILEDRRDLSLVDCLSFEVMQAHDIERVFGFDRHFEQAGFKHVSG